MINLIGTYEGKADAKLRLLLPAPLKKQLASVMQDGFVMKRSVHEQCLELYAMDEWNLLMNEISSINRFVKKNNDFIRIFTAGIKIVELDSAGRLLISKDLQAYAGITKEIVLAASGNVIEIWDKDKYEASINIAPDQFSALTEDVMGGIKKEL
ncbi:division/cell wall cluster transcriptional repressor MraZ [Lutibacter sp.]|jgi:MraZ protein|uniref:division/cell wall cluster transcriptional repressor MraZ n=1 Tax=Lutibacter sp. TaxID=1925666 RepID=UPI001A1C4D76|nr:division/cell wall cluster transcriptional repressor MraZ [Lutibacter sp.]MBI9041609.1 division/cell wall cluster transcriptional repressor MraZ [Lutibacter sp.]